MPEPMTRDQALARHGELMADKSWVKKYLGGDAAARAEMAWLHRVLVDAPSPKATPRQQAEARRAELMADPAWRQLYWNGDPAARAEMAGLHRVLAEELIP